MNFNLISKNYQRLSFVHATILNFDIFQITTMPHLTKFRNMKLLFLHQIHINWYHEEKSFIFILTFFKKNQLKT